MKHAERNKCRTGIEADHCYLLLAFFSQNKAVEFSKLQICVDLFLFSAQYTDVATLANLPKFTAGQLFYYPVSVFVQQAFRHKKAICVARTRLPCRGYHTPRVQVAFPQVSLHTVV